MKKNKKDSKPFAKYSALKIFFLILSFKTTRKNVLPLATTVFSNFFVIQQKQKFKLSHIPVVHVDHELDKCIPFTPSKVKIYLDFIWFVCRTLTMLFSKIEKESAINAVGGFESFFTDLYKNAGSIYSTTLTTTDRPKYFAGPKFITIHAFDPHLLCVPSLHVAIVAGLYAFIRKILDQNEINTYEKELILKEIYDGAVKITESVLYVKQHSINCVAGAMYMLTASHAEGFWTEKDACDFLDALFKDSDLVFPSDVLEIRNYMKEIYKGLLEDRKKQQIWQQALFNWLNNYKKN